MFKDKKNEEEPQKDEKMNPQEGPDGKTENEVKSEPKYFVSGEELLNKGIVEIPTLIDPILPKVGLVAICGSSDAGKSSFLRQLATAIVLGDSKFLGFTIKAKHQSTIYVSSEDDENAVS